MDPPPFGPTIQYHKHVDTGGQVSGFFPGLEKEDLQIVNGVTEDEQLAIAGSGQAVTGRTNGGSKRQGS